MELKDIFKSFFGINNFAKNTDTYQNVSSKESSLPSELIVPVAINNSRKYKLNDWISAVAAATNADSPNRKLLYDMYDSIMIDLHITAVLSSRIEPVWRAKFKVVVQKTKESNPELFDIFDMNWFEDFIQYAIESILYGYSLVELNNFRDLTQAEIILIPRQNVDPINGIIKLEAGDTKGYSYTEALAPYYIGIGNIKDLGLLYKITPVILAKKYAMGMWNEFNEKMVIPFRTVKTPSRDKKRHALLGQIMQEMGSAGWAVLNDEEVVELTELSGKDAYKAFETLIDRIENSITRAVLGQTATTNQDNTGTYGSLKILQNIAQDRHESDKTFIKRLTNNELIPRLIQFGQRLTGFIFDWDDKVELTTEQKIDLINKLNLNYSVDPKYVTEQTGIPVNVKQIQNITANGNKKKKSKNLSYFERIRNFYSEIESESNTDFSNDAEMDRILKSVHDGTLTKDSIDSDTYLQTANYLFGQVTKGFGQSLKDIKYDNANANMIQFMRGNIFKFSAAKDKKQFEEISAMLHDENGKIKPFQKFKDDVTGIYENYKKNWLQTEYITALAQSQSAASFADAVLTKDLYDLQYVTAGDERVRDDHAQYDGIVRPVDDGFWIKHLPPNGWRCRCKFRKVAKGTDITPIEKLRSVPKPEKGFSYNSGIKKMVFDENSHPYFDNLDLNELKAVDNYGMQTIEKIYSQADNLSDRKENWDLETFKTEWEKLAGKQKLKDKNSFILKTILGDKLLFDNALFNKIESEKKSEKRWEIASNLKEILIKPDEVWNSTNNSVKYGNNLLTYIKYYKDKTLVIVCNLKGDEIIRVSSFYEITSLTSAGHLGNLRTGVLLFKK